MGLPGSYKLTAKAAQAEARYEQSRVCRSAEGAYRDGPYSLPVTGGWLPAEAGQYLNWWQMGHDVQRGGQSPMVEACVSAYAQTVAMCPGNHWRWKKDAGRERVAGSALVRILRYPNDYQSISDFLLNAVRDLLTEGNAYALVLRNARYEPIELHLMSARSSAAQIATDGSIFYHLAGNPIVDARFGQHILVPARDVLHLKLHTPRHPLIGETPLAAAALPLAAGSAALQDQIRFYLNQSRPSFVLVTDQPLNPEQAAQVKQRWQEQSAGMNKGGVPFLTNGIKPFPISSSAKDSDLAAMLGLSDQAIAQVFRTPLQILGSTDKTPFASTEALMQSWRAGGLGFLLNHIEEALGLLFKLSGQPDEYIEFDTSALLRSSFKERVEGWVAGVKGGIFDRNTARVDFEMPPVDGGDEPWVQQQDMPLSMALHALSNPPAAPAPAVIVDPSVDTQRLADSFRKGIDERVARHTLSVH